MTKWLLIGIAFAVLPACSNKEQDLKSPCVGTDGSPCARRPVNDWWQHGETAPRPANERS